MPGRYLLLLGVIY